VKKPTQATKSSGTSEYLTVKDLRNLAKAHDFEVRELRNELQALRSDTMKLTTLLEAAVKHFCFELAMRPIGVPNVRP
jgi:hypothetical protein